MASAKTLADEKELRVGDMEHFDPTFYERIVAELEFCWRQALLDLMTAKTITLSENAYYTVKDSRGMMRILSQQACQVDSLAASLVRIEKPETPQTLMKWSKTFVKPRFK